MLFMFLYPYLYLQTNDVYLIIRPLTLGIYQNGKEGEMHRDSMFADINNGEIPVQLFSNQMQ